MPLGRYQSLMETLYLLSTPANAAHLAKSIAQHRSGSRMTGDVKPLDAGGRSGTSLLQAMDSLPSTAGIDIEPARLAGMVQGSGLD